MNYIRLKKDLIDYYGSAMPMGSPMAMTNVSKVERSTDDELAEMAVRVGFNLNNYKK